MPHYHAIRPKTILPPFTLPTLFFFFFLRIQSYTGLFLKEEERRVWAASPIYLSASFPQISLLVKSGLGAWLSSI